MHPYFLKLKVKKELAEKTLNDQESKFCLSRFCQTEAVNTANILHVCRNLDRMANVMHPFDHSPA